VVNVALERGRGPASAALAVLAALWTGLFLWRKTFSYIDIFGIYIIEVMAMAALAAFACYVALRTDLSFGVPKDVRLQRALAITGAFVGFSLIRAALSPSVSPTGLIPGIYPLYFLLVVVVAANATTRALRLTAGLFAALFFLSPLVGHLNALLGGVIGPVDSPGWTYVYGVSMAMALILVRHPVWSTLLFGIYFAYALLMFQRGVFIAFALAWLFAVLVAPATDRRVWVRAAFVRGGSMAVIAILTAPLLLNLLFGGQGARFTLTTGNMIAFFLSIIGAEGDLAFMSDVAGTRAHRLEMWRAIVAQVYASLPASIFGFGYQGEVGDAVGITFRSPHNGFVTVLYRTGTVGLLLFAGMLATMFAFFATALRRAGARSPVGWHACIGLIILGSLVGDALAGTIIDSPFTSMMFYAHAGVTAVIICRYNALAQQEPSPAALARGAGPDATGGEPALPGAPA
jgi:hypothetical protein